VDEAPCLTPETLVFELFLPLGASLSNESSIDDVDVLLRITLAPMTELPPPPYAFLDRRVVVPALLPLLLRWSCDVDGLMRLSNSDCGVTSTPSRYTRADCVPPDVPAPFTLRLELEIEDAPNAREARDAFTSRFVDRDDALIFALLALILADDGELMDTSERAR
jgi:hypothetical protein